MKIKMYEILNFLDTYDKIKSEKLKIQVVYKLSKCFDKCIEEQKFYQQEANKLINQYAEKNDDGDIQYNENKTAVLLKKETQLECNQKMNELLDLDIEIDSNLLLDINDFDIDLDIETFNKIKPFFKEV